MKNLITFDDVLIRPKFSTIKSRKDVNISTKMGSLHIDLPVISANMDTVTNSALATEMHNYGGIACLPRFCSIEEYEKQIKDLKSKNVNVIASVGVGEQELERAFAVIETGVQYLCIDVAHGAQQTVVDQFNKIQEKYKDVEIIVGNFADGNSIEQFKEKCKTLPLAFKVGVGGGAACLTRIQTGCGIPQLSAIISAVTLNPHSNIISDGGKKYPGDISKALATGAKAVMLGSMLAGTDESPGEVITDEYNNKFKKYRGSASQESYEDQGKIASWRTFEGDSFLVPYKGPVKGVLQNIEGGIRSAFTYVGARDLKSFQERSSFVGISYSTMKENYAHGKNISS